MSPKTSGWSSERLIASASEREFTICLFPIAACGSRAQRNDLCRGGRPEARYPQLAVDPTQSDAHGRLGADHRARSFYAALEAQQLARRVQAAAEIARVRS